MKLKIEKELFEGLMLGRYGEKAKQEMTYWYELCRDSGWQLVLTTDEEKEPPPGGFDG